MLKTPILKCFALEKDFDISHTNPCYPRTKLNTLHVLAVLLLSGI